MDDLVSSEWGTKVSIRFLKIHDGPPEYVSCVIFARTNPPAFALPFGGRDSVPTAERV
jgi:hypothetical protein